MPGEAPRWLLATCKRKLEAAEAEVVRLKERVAHLEGVVLDLGGDPHG
jgi:hypothetical protein